MRAIIVALALIIGAAPAAGAELSATMQRAAYCQGVLHYTLENNVPGQDTPDNVCLGWREQHYPTREACINDLEKWVHATLRQKLQRYTDYMTMEMAQRIFLHSGDNHAAMMSVLLIESKGRRDAQEVRSGSATTRHLQCVSQCRGKERRCLVDCVAEENPTAASVMRCVVLPDELPY